MMEKRQLNPLLKLALDFGPLALFFFANARPALFAPLLSLVLPASLFTGEHAGIFAATPVFMMAMLVALVVTYAQIRRLPVMMVVSTILVVVLGGLTLFLADETFFKRKPTIIYLLFSGLLFGGLLLRKPLMEIVFDQMFHLSEEGWRKLTVRWALFFLVLAVLNEIVWRNFSDDAWAAFKVFGALPLTFVFAMLQVPLLNKYAAPQAEQEKS